MSFDMEPAPNVIRAPHSPSLTSIEGSAGPSSVSFLRYSVVLTILICWILVCTLFIGRYRDTNFIGVDSLLAKKLAFLQQSPDKHDLIYFGSSYVFRSFQPRLFEEQLSKTGVGLKSYSFSAAGAFAFEVHHYLQEVLDFPQEKRPSLILINLFPVMRETILGVSEANRYIPRMIQYHDLRTTYFNIQALSDFEKWNTERKIEESVIHLRHMLMNYGNIGFGHLSWKPFDALTDGDKALTEEGGYYRALVGKKAQHKSFNIEGYLESVKRAAQEFDSIRADTSGTHLSSTDHAFRMAQSELVRSKGIKVVYVIPPISYKTDRELSALCNSPGFPPCIFMNNPNRFPELFKSENRYDGGHLNDLGANYFSTMLADEVKPFLNNL